MNRLPTISDGMVRTVRKNMNTQGYALVDTSHYLADKKWPSQQSAVFKTLNAKTGGYYISLKECSTDWIRALIRWQNRLLTKALPNEDFCVRGNGLSLRNEHHKKDGVSCWHVDGAYIRSICVMKGVPTSIMTDLGESPIPVGWTLFITASGRNGVLRVPSTLHRRPSVKKLRRVIVHGWYEL